MTTSHRIPLLSTSPGGSCANKALACPSPSQAQCLEKTGCRLCLLLCWELTQWARRMSRKESSFSTTMVNHILDFWIISEPSEIMQPVEINLVHEILVLHYENFSNQQHCNLGTNITLFILKIIVFGGFGVR